MLNKKRGQKGFTLIELLIVIAIIGILAAIAIPMYRAQTVKARLSEVTNSMSSVASAVGNFKQDEGTWPAAVTGAANIYSNLGVGLPNARYFEGANVSISGLGVITFPCQGTGETAVDNGSLILTPTTDSGQGGAIRWTWSASAGFPATYIPKQ